MTSQDIQALSSIIKEYLPKKSLVLEAAIGHEMKKGLPYFLFFTSAGTILGKIKDIPKDSAIQNLVPMTDVCIRTNDGHIFNIPSFFVLSDEIVAFQCLDDKSFQDLISQFQAQ